MKIIFVFAHPDDESFSSGGTIVSLKNNHATIKLITATKGEGGETNGICKKEELGSIREKELKSIILCRKSEFNKSFSKEVAFFLSQNPAPFFYS